MITNNHVGAHQMRTGVYPKKQYDTGLFSLFVNDPEDCHCSHEVFAFNACEVVVCLNSLKRPEALETKKVCFPLLFGELKEEDVLGTLRYSLEYMEEVKEPPEIYNTKIELDSWTLYFPEPMLFGCVAYNLSDKANFFFVPNRVKRATI